MAMDHTICKLQILDGLVQHTMVMIGLGGGGGGGGGGGSSDEIVVVVARRRLRLVRRRAFCCWVCGVWCVVVCGGVW